MIILKPIYSVYYYLFLLFLSILRINICNAEEKNETEVFAPYFTVRNMNDQPLKVKPVGASLTIDCKTNGTSPNITWLKDNKPLSRRPDITVKKWALKFEFLVFDHKGTYTCIVSNSAGSINFTYSVHPIEKMPMRPLMSELHPVNKTAFIGEDIVFNCKVKSDLTPIIFWIQYDGDTNKEIDITRIDKTMLLNKTSYSNEFVILTLKNVTLNDTGAYICIASNNFGTSSRTRYLTVMPKRMPMRPLMLDFYPVNKTAFVGEDVVFNCKAAKSDLTPIIFWIQYDSDTNKEIDIKRIDKTMFLNKTSYSNELVILTLKNVTLNHTGAYLCIASNNFGSSKRTRYLTVIPTVPTIFSSPCKLETCVHNLNELLSLPQGIEGERILNRNLIKTVECFQNCLQHSLLDDPVVNKSFHSFYKEISKNEEIYNILGRGQCIAQHLYELMACILDSFNLVPSKNSTEVNLIKCRQFHDVEHCPKKILLNTCGNTLVLGVESLLKTFTNTGYKLYCNSLNLNSILEEEITSMFDFKNLSKCYDENSKIVTRCLKLFHSSQSSEELQCRQPNIFVDCIEPPLSTICNLDVLSTSYEFFNSIIGIFDNSSCKSETSSISLSSTPTSSTQIPIDLISSYKKSPKIVAKSVFTRIQSTYDTNYIKPVDNFSFTPLSEEASVTDASTIRTGKTIDIISELQNFPFDVQDSVSNHFTTDEDFPNQNTSEDHEDNGICNKCYNSYFCLSFAIITFLISYLDIF